MHIQHQMTLCQTAGGEKGLNRVSCTATMEAEIRQQGAKLHRMKVKREINKMKRAAGRGQDLRWKGRIDLETSLKPGEREREREN